MEVKTNSPRSEKETLTTESARVCQSLVKQRISGGVELCFCVGDACPLSDKVERKTTNMPSELELKQPEKPQLI